jgi:23S rRNA pseudouridine1911/1915/1917 synthase
LAGEAVEGAGKGMVNLPDELTLLLPRETELIEAVHRIDVPVTGCVLFALTKKALSFLNSIFHSDTQSEKLKKKYWAITEKSGKPETPGLKTILTHYIETNSRLNKSFVYQDDRPGRKKAVLYYKMIKEGQNYLFLEIDLFTGRHHQIRAQLAATGKPVKGDLKYGAKRSEKAGGIRLHAYSLSFPDPVNKKGMISLKAQPPQMDNLWEAFIQSIQEGASHK